MWFEIILVFILFKFKQKNVPTFPESGLYIYLLLKSCSKGTQKLENVSYWGASLGEAKYWKWYWIWKMADNLCM